jgi:hypothetical protein
MAEKQEAGLALRVEGEMWNAYFATSGTMAGAKFLGSIHVAAVQNNEERKQAFITLMSGFVADVLEDILGVRPDSMDVRSAPEHERGGSA